MNDNYSDIELKNEPAYHPRWLTPQLARAIKEHPVVVVTGARQVGKSTLLRQSSPTQTWRYWSLDNFDAQRQAEHDPQGLWAEDHRVIIDEVQKQPRLLSSIKEAVDQSRGRTRFVLSGSANLLLMRQVSESLAGRAVYLTLSPMTLGEMRNRQPPTCLEDWLGGKLETDLKKHESSEDPLGLILDGFMPRLMALKSHAARLRWWEGYTATYLERDLRQLSQVDSLSDYRRVMEVLALRSGQIINQTHVARDSGVSQPTVHRYLNLLETTCLVDRLPAYARNRTKRLIKSPKVYWTDPALACFLSGLYDRSSLGKARERGSLFENLIYHHLRVSCNLLTPWARLFYWRTTAADEVDFVVEWGRKLIALEVKLTTSPSWEDCRGLEAFLSEYPESSAGILLHAGTGIRRFGQKIAALPWTVLV